MKTVTVLASAACILVWGSARAEAEPITFDIPVQTEFGSTLSGFLTFDPAGIYFGGPFDISIGEIPTAALPANTFTSDQTAYVIQPNTSFHSLWVFNPATPFDHLFL